VPPEAVRAAGGPLTYWVKPWRYGAARLRLCPRSWDHRGGAPRDFAAISEAGLTMMRVALVYAPIDDDYYTDGVNDSLPLGLLALYNHAVRTEQLDVDVDIFDGEYWSVEEISARLPEYDMLCVQSMMASYRNTLVLLERAKQAGLFTVLGGHHATQLFREILTHRHHVLDCVVRGDGEYAFADLLRRRPLGEIPGVAHVEGGQVRVNPVRPFPINDNLLTDVEDRFLEQYRRPPVRATRLERLHPLTSVRAFSHKGCSNRFNSQYCFFCGRADKDVRFKSPENYVGELERLFAMPGVRYVFEIGDDFLQDHGWLAAVAGRYEERLTGSPVQLKIFARANRVVPEVLPHLRRMNVTEVAIGFESGSDDVLKRISKRSTTADNMNAARLLFDSGIDTVASYVLGLPGETDETLEQTYDQASRIRDLALRHLGRPPQEIIANIIEVNPGAPAFTRLRRAFPNRYAGRDDLDVKQTQDDYFRCVFELAGDQEVACFRRRLVSAGSRINALGTYSYRAGWTKEDVVDAR